MQVLGPIASPAPHLASITATRVFQGGTVGLQPIRHDHPRPTVLFHLSFQEFKDCLAISDPGDDAF